MTIMNVNIKWKAKNCKRVVLCVGELVGKSVYIVWKIKEEDNVVCKEHLK